MSIQRQVIHIYIIVVGAVLLAVQKFHDYILARQALVEADAPLSVAGRGKHP
jgi:hypothetical protein